MTYQTKSFVASESISSDRFDAHEFVLQSFARAIRGAPIENRRKVYRLIAHDAFRRCCTDLWQLAYESGLADLVGETTVADDLAASFWGRR
jgi:hypothetical protein